MSFCQDQKLEILSENIRSKCCLKALFEGIMVACGRIEDDKVHLVISKELAPYLQSYCMQLYSTSLDAVERKKGGRQIEVCFFSASARRFLSSVDETGTIVPSTKCNTCYSCFLKGLFLVCGAISDPSIEYRLELKPVVGEKRLSAIKTMLSLDGINFRVATRGGKSFLYTKKSSVIEDYFALANLNQVTFALMNQKIEHEIRNNANRISNCEMSNIEKAVTASSRHLGAIEALEKAGLLSSLPEELEETARLRLLYPDLTISQLANLMTPAITKSGLTHRLNKILKTSEELLGSV